MDEKRWSSFVVVEVACKNRSAPDTNEFLIPRLEQNSATQSNCKQDRWPGLV
jgi:hypothetical protein